VTEDCEELILGEVGAFGFGAGGLFAIEEGLALGLGAFLLGDDGGEDQGGEGAGADEGLKQQEPVVGAADGEGAGAAQRSPGGDGGDDGGGGDRAALAESEGGPNKQRHSQVTERTAR
jgi:hypothetical protein